jgi:hypothetical protein
VIPTLILGGLIVGRWWLVAIAAIGWPILLIGTKVGTGFTFAVGSAAFGAANTAAGVAVHKAAVTAFRKLRTRSRE